MATRESATRLAAPIQLVTSRLPRPVWPIIALPILAFAIAFAVDVATERRFSQIWGSLALLASAGIVPAVRRAALPVAAYGGVWVGFNALRAAADDAGLKIISRRAVSGLEAWLAGGELPSAMAQRTVVDPTRLGVLHYAVVAVYLSFFVVPHVVAVVLLVRKRNLFWNVVAASALLFGGGALAFAVAPTVPPWLAASRDPALGEVDRLPHRLLSELGVQFGQTAGMEQGYGFEPNSFASMPSIHLGVTVLIAAVAWQSRTVWRWAAVAYATVMGIALVVSGEHYVLDVLAGSVVAVAAWALSARFCDAPGASGNSVGSPGRSVRPSGHAVPASCDRAFGRGTEPRSARPIATSAGDLLRRGE